MAAGGRKASALKQLVQILLPLYDNSGKPFPVACHRRVKKELMSRFEGPTSYSRAPAEGIWTKGRTTKRESIVVYEVMVPLLDEAWWRRYRKRLEKRFRQQSVVIRSQKMKLL